MPLSPGTCLGPYEIISPIGAGGMGEVYKGRDTRLNRTVAIKVLPAEVAADPRARERFEREARAVAALNHPHICTLFDIGREQNIDFIVMEHLVGDTLRGPLPVAEAVRLAGQIASALDAAHQQGILHRDLKPGNIFIVKSAGGSTPPTAKLLDFGLAKLMTGEADATRTTDGMVVGTIAYMSPEQAEGRPVDTRSDIFSFGAVLYEMIAGRRAFGGQTTAGVFSAILRDEPPSFQAPPALDRLVRRCLAKFADQRFPSMAEVRAALDHVPHTIARELPSIAVLPFASMSPDPENEFFSDGISEEIINALTQVDGLHVAARTSSFSFKGKAVEVGEIARRLNVRHVLEGSVRKAGPRVRVNAQLVDAMNGFQLWSERYDRQLADIFDVQDEIARAIVERLKVALAGPRDARIVKVATTDMEAYQHYLKGRAMLYRRGPWISRALDSFQQAVDRDPDYAQAWAGLADAHTVLGYSGHCRGEETMPSALAAATKAIELDPASAEGHNALAVAALLWERDFAKAEREFLEALSLNEKYIQARCWYGLFYLLWAVGRQEEGMAEVRRALDEDPLSSYVTSVWSMALGTVGRRAEAVTQARLAVQHDPASFISQWQCGNACQWGGYVDEAIAVLEPEWASSQHNWIGTALVAAYVRAGRIDDARRLFDALKAQRADRYIPPSALAVCSSALGDHEAALAFCEDCVREKDMLFALFQPWLPDFDRLRADPRFPAILARFNARR